MKRELGIAGLVLSCLATTGPAAAAPPRKLELGASVMGYVGGSFLTEPSDKSVAEGIPQEYVYPGFAGVGGGGGVGLQLAYEGWLGLVVDVLYTSDKGRGTISGVDVTIGQMALHVPVMARLAIPSEHFRPFIQVGPEFVFPGEAEADYDQDRVRGSAKANASSYMSVAFGVGCEFMLPIEGVDLRVPFALRGNINPSTPDTARDRMTISESQQQMDMNSEWEYQAGISLGLSYYFM